MIAGLQGNFLEQSLYERVIVATYLHSAIAQELAAEDSYVEPPTMILAHKLSEAAHENQCYTNPDKVTIYPLNTCILKN